MTPPRRALPAALAASALALLLAPAAASAATAAVSGGVLSYTGGSEVNTLTITRSGTAFTVSDTTGVEAPGAGCGPAAGGTVTCAAAGVTKLEVRVNGGADVVRIKAATPASLYGGTGDDLLSGGGGDDLVEGGAGADELGGGSAGRDTATYAGRTGAVTVDFDGVADDGSSFDASGGVRDDVYDSIDAIVGTSAGDTLRGDDRATTLNGGPGDDTLDGGFGADTLTGGSGTGDTVTYAGRSEAVTVDIDGFSDDGSANDQTGADRDKVDPTVEHVTGGNGGDTLTGSAGVNTLNGGAAGDDTLNGGEGADTLINGPGNDTVSYGGRSDKIVADLDNVRDDGAVGGLDGPNGDHIVAGTENLTGGGGDDTLTGNSANNRLDGGAGADDLFGGTGAGDTASYAGRLVAIVADIDASADDGSAGDTSGSRRDRIDPSIENITGGNGADTLVGSPGANRLEGGEGNDRLSGGSGPDALIGDGGIDGVTYATRTTSVAVKLDNAANDGGSGGGEGDDVRTENVLGGKGGDYLEGDGAANKLEGGEGVDHLNGLGGGDVVDGGGSTDYAHYDEKTQPVVVTIDGTANDGVAGEGDNLLATVEGVIGGQGDDSLTGNDEGNALAGGPGHDSLDGKGGPDTMGGNAGADVFNGGDGQDVVSYSAESKGITVTVDGTANDGSDNDVKPGTTIRDNVMTNVEDVRGTAHVDSLTAGPNGTILYGLGENDSLIGGPGADKLYGWTGTDTLQGFGGGDILDGGDGAGDTVTYAERGEEEGVGVSLNGSADDGGFNEFDNVTAQTENITGSEGIDTLQGNDQDNYLNGLGGNDTIYAAAGNDTLEAGDGSDDLFGDDGDDTLLMAGDGFNIEGDYGNCGEGPDPEADIDTANGDTSSDSYDGCENIFTARRRR